ncbi:MAG: UDP-3-O-(3-hydroxymyristoyl)glucosamine N-acyltransferase [Bacteroidia bacterium]
MNTIKFTAAQIAALLQANITGDASVEVSNVCKIEEGKTGCLAFLANLKYEPFLYETAASIVLVAKDFVAKQPTNATLLHVDDPYTAFTFLLNKVQEAMTAKMGIEQPSFIAKSAKIGKNVYIGAFAYICENVEIGDNCKIYPNVYVGDNCKIGENTTIFPNVTLYRESKVGKNCIFHSGTVIGADGFGFAPQKDGSYLKIPQLGNVIIENDVEIGSNVSIDRAMMPETSTIIESGVKIDNLIQIAHNVIIGKNTVIAAQTGISGSTKLGENCLVGGQVGIVGHLVLAKGTKIGAQSGISKSVNTENTDWRGSPAQPYKKQLRTEVLLRQLEDLFAKVRELEKKLQEKP